VGAWDVVDPVRFSSSPRLGVKAGSNGDRYESSFRGRPRGPGVLQAGNGAAYKGTGMLGASGAAARSWPSFARIWPAAVSARRTR